jgi:hypothetical protein
MRVFRCLAAAFAAVLWAAAAIHAADLPPCDVAIIGGGPGGVHTAYKLTTQHLTQGSVCLFEMSNNLGGRVGDNFNVGFSGTPFVNNGVSVEKSGQTGTGGYRMYFNHYAYKLGQELAALGRPGQLTFLRQVPFSRLLAVQNPNFTEGTYFTYDNFGIAKHFAPLYNSPINNDDIWNVLLCGPQVPVENNFPQYRKMSCPSTASICIPESEDLGNMSTRGYLEWVAKNVISAAHGPQVAQYLVDTWRFRGDFDSPNDAVGYLEFTATDYTGGATIYPIPSFQPYFDIMQSQIKANRGSIFLSEKVLSVNRVNKKGTTTYELTTDKGNTVTANRVVIATNHAALDPKKGGMTGDVINAIVGQAEYKHVQTINAVTVTHQFGDGENPVTGWWRGDITYPGPNLLGPQLTSSNPLRRSTNNVLIAGENLPGCESQSCDFSTRFFFNNTNELPLTVYHDFINISRSVYNDKDDAVNNWIDLYKAGGNDAVNRQILKSLRVMYPKVFTGDTSTEPPILATQFTQHTPAWYLLKKGALGQAITNDSLFEWSLSPLPGEPVHLVGDTWSNDLSGWSEGAYKGSIQVLNRYFGAKIDPKEEQTIKCANGNINGKTVDPD